MVVVGAANLCIYANLRYSKSTAIFFCSRFNFKSRISTSTSITAENGCCEDPLSSQLQHRERLTFVHPLLLIIQIAARVKKGINVFFKLYHIWFVDVVHMPCIVKIVCDIFPDFRAKKHVFNIILCRKIRCSKVVVSRAHIYF